MLKIGQQRIAISCHDDNGIQWCISYFRTLFIAMVLLSVTVSISDAGTPITLYRTFAGNLNYVTTGGTLRTASNTAYANSACAVTTGPVSAVLTGIPVVGSTIEAAYLYWAGSGSTPDYDVTFNGTAVTDDRNFTETYVNASTTLAFFSGFKNVTAYVTGNGTYTFSDLDVNTGDPHCGTSNVLSGWALLVIYRNASEPLRVVNVYDGFQYFWGSSITLTPNNFRIPASSIDGKHTHITWEGDVENSQSRYGYNERFRFNGNTLTDGYNPANNQFNSTINTLPTNTSYGVDIDTFNISAFLTAGATSATTVYSSGQDMVLLNAEVLSVTNSSVADLRLTKTHSGSFPSGGTGTFQLTVHNNGPSTATGPAGSPIRVTDTIPAGLVYSTSSGIGWTVDTSSLPTVRWNYVGVLASGDDLPPITLQVSVTGAAGSNITNTATVSGPDFDHDLTNNSSSDTVTVILPPNLTVLKQISTDGGATFPVSPLPVNPGATLTYRISVANTGTGNATSVVIIDPKPAYTTYVGGSAKRATGAGVTYAAAPTALSDAVDGDGYDFNITTSGVGTYSVGTITPGGANAVQLFFRATVN